MLAAIIASILLVGLTLLIHYEILRLASAISCSSGSSSYVGEPLSRFPAELNWSLYLSQRACLEESRETLV